MPTVRSVKDAEGAAGSLRCNSSKGVIFLSVAVAVRYGQIVDLDIAFDDEEEKEKNFVAISGLSS